MKPLNLDRLNIRSPYSVWQISAQCYGFKTDYDVLYRLCFTDDATIWEEGAYEFCILNENSRPSPNDPNVKETVLCIIEEFFRLNPDILLYQCETGDNRQAMRERLFLRWFREYDRSDRYYIKVSEIIAEKVANYTAMIVQKDNPHLDEIIRDFDEFVGFFKNKPEESA